VRRPERIRVTGYDERGRKTSFGATGLWARLIQHELDHLDGVLFTDRLEKPEDLYRLTENRARVPAFHQGGGAVKPASEKEPALT